MNKRLILLLVSLFTININALADPALNKDGSPVTGILVAGFDPQGSVRPESVFPFPSSLALTTTTDMTLDIPVEDPNDFSDPAVALSTLDGYSTTEKWIASPFLYPNRLQSAE